MNKINYKIWYNLASKTAERILERTDELMNITDNELKEKSLELKNSAQNTKYKRNYKIFLRDYLIEAFAIASVASFRILNKKPYKVQLIAGIAIVEGNIAEQKTGEGKTLTALLPSYLYGLLGYGVHVVTVNPYLTERDGNEMGKVLNFLGLSIGIVLPDMKIPEKQKAYNSHVTYVSNADLGFDYLRDLLALNKENLLIPNLFFSIIDEVDSILLDEAKTPLIISGPPKNSNDLRELFIYVDDVVKSLEKGYESSKFSKVDSFFEEENDENKRVEKGDFIVHEKEKNVTLTNVGINKIENKFNLENYSNKKNKIIQMLIEKSLYANYILIKDKDYIVKNNKIELVDEFTGRVLDGRKYSDGLHQAIEAKERVEITSINQTQASITYQNFFRKYKILSGMTATAFTEKKEFKDTYELDVIPIKTNKPVLRKDYKDKIFVKKDDKYNAVIKEIKKAKSKGQPILCATTNLNESEYLSSLLKKNNIYHNVLNAKQDKNEAEVISKAGVSGAITVATNMAGRGTDIKLDEKSKNAGGLYVIGTEKHESKRIDNQLRGRSGRQGDIGKSVFYISTEDRLIKHYAGDRFFNLLKNSGFDNGEEIKNKKILKAIDISQKKVNLDNYFQRKNTLEYDDIDNTLKEKIYSKRKDILISDDSIFIRNISYIFLEKYLSGIKSIEDYGQNEFLKRCIKQYKNNKGSLKKTVEKTNDIISIKRIMLYCIDNNMQEFISSLDFLRNAVSYISLSGKSNKAYYSKEAYELFDSMLNNIYKDFSTIFFERFYKR